MNLFLIALGIIVVIIGISYQDIKRMIKKPMVESVRIEHLDGSYELYFTKDDDKARGKAFERAMKSAEMYDEVILNVGKSYVGTSNDVKLEAK